MNYKENWTQLKENNFFRQIPGSLARYKINLTWRLLFHRSLNNNNIFSRERGCSFNFIIVFFIPPGSKRVLDLLHKINGGDWCLLRNCTVDPPNISDGFMAISYQVTRRKVLNTHQIAR